MWEFVVEHFKEYIGVGLLFIFYLAAVIRLFIVEKRKEYRILFVYMPALVLLIFFNPFFAKLMSRYADEETYFRVMWLLPVTITIGYTLTDMMIKAKGKLKIVIAIIGALLIVVGGRLVYLSPNYEVAQNEYHVPQEIVDICDEIKIEGREIKAAFPLEMVVYVRQYTPLIVLAYGYDEIKYLKPTDDLISQMESDAPVAEILFTAASNQSCHYVIISEEKSIIGSSEDYGFSLVSSVDGYLIFKNNDKNLY